VFVEAKTEVIPLMVNQSITSLAKDNQTCSIELHCINGGVLKITALPIASSLSLSQSLIPTVFMGLAALTAPHWLLLEI
jgi:hypothetical protein